MLFARSAQGLAVHLSLPVRGMLSHLRKRLGLGRISQSEITDKRQWKVYSVLS